MRDTGGCAARSFALGSLAVVIIASPAWADFLAVNYLPLAPGNFWAYLVDGTDAGTTTVLPEMEKVNGRSTFVLEDTGGEFSGATENQTKDSNGLRLHKLVIPPPDGVAAAGHDRKAFAPRRSAASTAGTRTQDSPSSPRPTTQFAEERSSSSAMESRSCPWVLRTLWSRRGQSVARTSDGSTDSRYSSAVPWRC